MDSKWLCRPIHEGIHTYRMLVLDYGTEMRYELSRSAQNIHSIYIFMRNIFILAILTLITFSIRNKYEITLFQLKWMTFELISKLFEILCSDKTFSQFTTWIKKSIIRDIINRI